jgi:putative transposon-encoded protein
MFFMAAIKLEKIVKKFGNSGYIGVSKKFIGKKAKVTILSHKIEEITNDN